MDLNKLNLCPLCLLQDPEFKEVMKRAQTRVVARELAIKGMLDKGAAAVNTVSTLQSFF